MKKLFNRVKIWWNNPCFWSHDEDIVATEQSACVYKCTKCGNIRIYRGSN